MWVKHLFHSSRMHKAILFLHLSRHKVCRSIYEVLPLPAVFVLTLRILSFFHIHKGYCSIPGIWLCLLHARSIPHHSRNNASFPFCIPVLLSSGILHSNSPLPLFLNSILSSFRKSSSHSEHDSTSESWWYSTSCSIHVNSPRFSTSQ